MRRVIAVAMVTMGLGPVNFAQENPATRYADPVLMPAERANDSYAIYSQLLKSGPIEWRDVKRTQWLVEDTTHAMPLTQQCSTATDLMMGLTNPHTAVSPPVDRQPEWQEVLSDFDQHCHDVIQLRQDNFKTALPVRLLDANGRRHFAHSVFAGSDSPSPSESYADLTGAAGLDSFSEVYFNAHHTLALVEQGMWCGASCGNWSWVVLEKKDGAWHMLPWVHTESGA